MSQHSAHTPEYNHAKIEEKWQAYWEKNNFFQQIAAQDVAAAKDRLYLLFAFAYPFGSGLHVGHVEGKTALDVLARHGRMNGKKVFFHPRRVFSYHGPPFIPLVSGAA